MADKGKSPYRKYDKKPYKYSTLYQEWRAALKSGDSSRVQRASDAHRAYWLAR